MKRQQQLFSNYIDTICGKFNCLEAASPLKEGFLALCEAGEQPAAGMKIEPGWPEKDSNFDYASAFDKCPYAADFINMLKEELEKLGTINFGEPVVIDDRGPADNLRMGGLHLSMNRYNDSRPFPFLYVYAPMTGRGKPMPISSKNIGEIHNPGNNFEISSKIIWVPNGYFKGDDVPANARIQITPENMGDVVKQIVDRVKWFTDNYLDLDACNMMLNVHRKWLSRRARNVADTAIGKKFVEKFNALAENTPMVSGKNFWNEPYEMHAVGIEKGRDLNRVGINKLDIYTMHGGEINMRDPYTLRCTSDGSVVLVGHNESLDYGSILLTEDNWAEVCNDVFNEVCEIEKEGAAAAEEKKAREQAREAGRVMCNRQKIKDKFGEFLYKKFFDVIDDGELDGKTTDEIITDLKCAIAEDRAEYDLMAKQDAIRAGKVNLESAFGSDETEGGKRFHALTAGDSDIEIDDEDVEKIKAGEYTDFIEKLRAAASPCGKCFVRPDGRWFTENSLKTDVLDVMDFNLKHSAKKGEFAKCILDNPREKAWFFDTYSTDGTHSPWAEYIKW